MNKNFILSPFNPLPENLGEVSLTGKLSTMKKNSGLTLDFFLKGNLEYFSLPQKSQVPSQRLMNLWQGTCFELFFSLPGEESYCEGNFSPSGNWNFFSFSSYRQGMKECYALNNPEIHSTHTDQFFTISIAIPFPPQTISFFQSGKNLPAEEFFRKLRLGVCAVLEEKEKSNHSFWGLKHLGSKPDFHLSQSFSLHF